MFAVDAAAVLLLTPSAIAVDAVDSEEVVVDVVVVVVVEVVVVVVVEVVDVVVVAFSTEK